MNMFGGLTGVFKPHDSKWDSKLCPVITVFNAWPQCQHKQDCNKEKSCIAHCSDIEGIVLPTAADWEVYGQDLISRRIGYDEFHQDYFCDWNIPKC